MKNIIKLNKTLGWILIIGIIITQILITIVTFDLGGMALFFAFLTALIFIPYMITSVVSVLSRTEHLEKIKNGIKVGIFFQVCLPVFLPLFFDKEFIFLSFVGVFLGVIMWCFRKNIEIQLIILNGIGAVVWVLLTILSILIE